MNKWSSQNLKTNNYGSLKIAKSYQAATSYQIYKDFIKTVPQERLLYFLRSKSEWRSGRHFYLMPRA